MGEPALDTVVGPDGTDRIDVDELRRLGARPGVNVRLLVAPRRRIRSRLGAHNRGLGFTQEHLDELRREMTKVSART